MVRARDSPVVSTSRSSEPRDEAAIIAAAADGDRQAFRLLYEANVRPILAYITRRVPATEAEDIAAETFAKAWQNLGSYEDRGRPFVAWLYTIAGNLLTSRGRTIQRRGIPDELPSELSADGFEDRLITRLGHEHLAGALRGLRPAHRQVLELRFLGEQTVAETAVVIGISEDGVRALTYRALAALRADLAINPVN